jgi:hypothetical protein
MSIRASGFARVPADLYQTPPWLIDALAEHVNLNGLCVWEPACGEGQMVRALEAHGAHVTATDLHDHGFEGQIDQFDFVGGEHYVPGFYFDSIISNPPYGAQGKVGEAFIAAGLAWIPSGGLLALLLPVDFDSAKTRARFFGDCPEFAAKIILRRRIAWFEPQPGQAGPSANHAWFIWTRSHIRAQRAPLTLYAPAAAVVPLHWPIDPSKARAA